jgi:hypothetical protein
LAEKQLKHGPKISFALSALNKSVKKSSNISYSILFLICESQIPNKIGYEQCLPKYRFSVFRLPIANTEKIDRYSVGFRFQRIKSWIFFILSYFMLYHCEPVVVLHQFLWVSRKFEIAVSFVKILVRSSAWAFFPSYFFYSFYQILIRRWDVDLHAKFQPYNIFL